MVSIAGTIPVDFIRHGSTALNDHGGNNDRIRGWRDVPLDDRGIKEAHDMGRKLARSASRPNALVSSDLQRSRQTAHIMSQESGISHIGSDMFLRPWNLGHLQGQESKKVAPVIQQFLHNPNMRVPNGESFAEFYGRFIGGLKQLLRSHNGARLGIVSHHRNERVLAGLDRGNWQHMDPHEFSRHGDAPGHTITFHIPIAWLQS